jgi:uncharacterized membrane protein YdjX (TVP38/TMEM64 family)
MTSAPLRNCLTWRDLWPTIRTGSCIVAMFALALLLARRFDAPLRELLAEHAVLSIAVFVATSALAVLLPLLTNLPILPLAVLAWGPWWSAALLLLGWIAGAMLSFSLGRYARESILRYFPSVSRHADIDRLIHPRHRLLSLVLLRMTFPVDVLSYALGLFSRATTLSEVALSTALGAAPFALVFALLPALSLPAQVAVFGGSLLAFALYVLWVIDARPPRQDPRSSR